MMSDDMERLAEYMDPPTMHAFYADKIQRLEAHVRQLQVINDALRLRLSVGE